MDARLTRIYERYGRLYVVGGIAAIVLVSFAYTLLGVACIGDYFELSAGELSLAAGAIISVTAIALTLGFAIRGRLLSPMMRWSDGDRSATLRADAGVWAFQNPNRLFNAVYGLILVSAVPLTIVVMAILSEASPSEVIGIAIAAATIGASAWIVTFVQLETLLNPIRRSVELHETVPNAGLRYGTTILALPIILSFTTLGLMGLLLSDRGDPASPSMPAIYAIAALFTLVGGGVIAGLLWVTARWPINSLIAGNRQLGRGESDPRIPVTNSNDLGELATSFNEMVAELRASDAELRASRERIVTSSDRARRQVERDLHDGAQQNLVLLNLKLGLLEKQLANDPGSAEAASEIRAELERALSELRDLAHGIYPQVLTSDGLGAALSEAAVKAAIPTAVSADGAGRFAPELEAAVYFCCLEALQNAAKYAGEDASAKVKLARTDGELRFEVSDDGAGFDPASVNGSAGLQNMADRIGALGGELKVESAPGDGTSVVGSVPLPD